MKKTQCFGIVFLIVSVAWHCVWGQLECFMVSGSSPAEMLPPYICCDLSEWQATREESAVLFTFEHQILKLAQGNWTAETVIFNFYGLLIWQTIFITLIGTEMMFVMPVYAISNLNINLIFKGILWFSWLHGFFYPSFMHSAKLNQNKPKEKTDSLKQIYYFIPSLDRNFHWETRIEHSIQPSPADLHCRCYKSHNDVK